MLDIHFHCDNALWKKQLTSSRKNYQRALTACFDALELPKRRFAVEVSFIDDAEIKTINAQYRNKNNPTNVLSFPLIDDFSALEKWPGDLALGDIVLAYETIFSEAEEQGKSFNDHVMHLLVHGLLHLFGHDHMNKKDAAEMEALEIQVLAELGIDNPY